MAATEVSKGNWRMRRPLTRSKRSIVFEADAVTQRDLLSVAAVRIAPPSRIVLMADAPAGTDGAARTDVTARATRATRVLLLVASDMGEV